MKKALLSLVALGALASTAALADPMLYVAAGSANKVLAINPNTNKVVEAYDNIDNPHALVATPDGEYLVAGSLKEKKDKADPSKPPQSTIYIIHPAHGHVMGTFPAQGMIHHQAITPNGNYVISTHPTQGAISYTDIENDEGSKQIKTGPGPNYTAITADGGRAFVSNTGNGTISEIDLKAWKVVRSLRAGSGPEHLALSPDEKTLYAINAREGTVSAVSIENGAVSRSWDIGKSAHGLDLSEDGKTLFATSKKMGILVAINLEDDTRKELSLSPEPYHLEFIKDTGKLYVSSSKAPKIWVIDPKRLSVEDEITIEGEGHQMAMGVK